ncbi:hypothetical protein LOH54_07685 [Sulfurimonas sp. HSL-3221]|uniref:hypothetical protein n=1 Tax=Sulfurimonadaceae TaxID=2771471 RepID=UPI001E30D24C|nr:hypothetical protein [Sulfurimonas sp. HSL-3221]UFS61542.1 hypothetical protein LOH54_07685 [Sulfurimonas sp. HSL-3221]
MKALTQNMMTSGARFVELLDKSGLKPKAAFWIYNPEQDAWQLLVGHVDTIDDAAFDAAVAELMALHDTELPELALTDIGLAFDDAPILELLNSVVNTGDEILGINFSREEINGVVIDGVFLYRMNITEPVF